MNCPECKTQTATRVGYRGNGRFSCNECDPYPDEEKIEICDKFISDIAEILGVESDTDAIIIEIDRIKSELAELRK